MSYFSVINKSPRGLNLFVCLKINLVSIAFCWVEWYNN